MQETVKTMSIKMAALELSIWDEKHEKALIKDFGYNQKTLAIRKSELQKIVNNQII